MSGNAARAHVLGGMFLVGIGLIASIDINVYFGLVLVVAGLGLWINRAIRGYEPSKGF